MLPTGSDSVTLVGAAPFGSALQIDAGMVNWAHSRDPILQRYGVGGVARAAIASGAGLAAVMDADGLKALVSALSEDDPQAQCFAAAALGEDACLRSLASSWRCLEQTSCQTCSFTCSGHHPRQFTEPRQLDLQYAVFYLQAESQPEEVRQVRHWFSKELHKGF